MMMLLLLLLLLNNFFGLGKWGGTIYRAMAHGILTNFFG